MRASSSIAAMVFVLHGCVSPRQRGYPLYTASDSPRGPQEVAQLGGYVWLVDGRNVADYGTQFELLPGCHLVTTPTAWGRVEPNSGGVMVHSGHLTFALPMKPGYRYVIDVQPQMMGGGNTGRAAVQAAETDLNGDITRVFAAVKSQAEVEACKQGGSSAASSVERKPESVSANAPSTACEEDSGYRDYVVDRRKNHPAGQWQSSAPAKWEGALRGYAPSVKTGNQRRLGGAIRGLAKCFVRLHNRIHVVFTDEFLEWLAKQPSSEPRNEPSLQVRLEIVIGGLDGRIVRMGVVRPSGLDSFDIAALDTVEQAGPFPPPPPDSLSSDGNLYVHWEFHRDPVFACSTINARPFRLSLE